MDLDLFSYRLYYMGMVYSNLNFVSMVKYDPNNPLTDEELDKLGKEDFDTFLEYLDSKSAHLRKNTKPLDEHHIKKFSAMDAQSRGESIDDTLIQKAKKIAKDNQ